MVGGIVLIDVALLTAWEVEDPLKWTQFNFTQEVSLIFWVKLLNAVVPCSPS